MTHPELKGREVILEFTPIGSVVKVTAFDSISLTEISIQGPLSTPQSSLEQAALSRLVFVLRKKGLIA
jgi:hypothetical protein